MTSETRCKQVKYNPSITKLAELIVLHVHTRFYSGASAVDGGFCDHLISVFLTLPVTLFFFFFTKLEMSESPGILNSEFHVPTKGFSDLAACNYSYSIELYDMNVQVEMFTVKKGITIYYLTQRLN